MQLSTVLLDAGGVIVDESEMEQHIARLLTDMLTELVPGYSLQQYWRDVEGAVINFAPRTYQAVIWMHTAPDRPRCDRLFNEFRETWRATRPPLRLMDGIGAEIREMAQELRVGLAGQYGADVLELLERHGLLDALAWRFTQDDFGITKPDPRYFEQIAARCGVEPGECVLVGDRVDKDVVPARMVGMATIRIRTGIHRNQEPRLPEEVPDLELPGVRGLAAAVRDLARSRERAAE